MCRRGPTDRHRHDPRLEQDMDVMLEADVEYFDHPTQGRIRLRDVLVCPPEPDIELEQELTAEWP